MSEETPQLYAIYAETNEQNCLFEIRIPLERLFDSYIDPYQQGKAFFIDGVRVKNSTLVRFKVVKFSGYIESELATVHRTLRRGSPEQVNSASRNYSTIVLGLLRGAAEDQTNQLVRAYEEKKSLLESATDLAERFKAIASMAQSFLELGSYLRS